MPKPTVTVNVKRLEAAGLPEARDRRHRPAAAPLSPTSEGRKATTRGLALLSDAFGRRMSRLSAAKQAELKALLEKLL